MNQWLNSRTFIPQTIYADETCEKRDKNLAECDSKTGYVYYMNIYSGKETGGVQGTLGERVVSKLMETIRGKDVVLAFDRFFTSVHLMEILKFPAVGMCIKTRKDVPNFATKLSKRDVPNPPRIEHVDCDGLSAMVVWKPMGDRRAPILSYSVQFNTSFTPDTWENAFKNIPAADTRVKVEMSPWANYTFRVRARNKIGPSEPSGPSHYCATPEAVPYKNPDKVMGRGTQPDNLVISWTPMPLIEHNAPEFFYKLFWKRDDDPQATWKSEKITDWRQNQLVVDYQPTFKRYRIKVEAHNRRGQAPVPPEVIGYSGEDVPKEAPLNFRLLHIRDAKSAVFEWNPVSPDSLYGHFRGYKIQTWTSEETEDHLREVIVPRNVTEALVDIFRPYSRNIVRVCAFNDVYNGPPSDAIDFLTPEGTPGPVSYFEAIPMGASALYLIWKRPMEPNGNLTGYRIYYRKVDGTSLGTVLERQPAITDSRETRAKLAGLQPDTKYRVIIHACTRVGQGDPYYIEVKTNEQAAENGGSKLLGNQYHVLPLILDGDLNIDFDEDEGLGLVQFLKPEFNLDFVSGKELRISRKENSTHSCLVREHEVERGNRIDAPQSLARIYREGRGMNQPA
ncbi:neuroglian [Trichonephila clavipes]|uniref:Neuroglian n=1 Tax=Trichonephila clavipes TaxID=2585209 RepID=A0A8X6SDX6_TRICX|nr:neuroglian [Trichonephila clavipes]